MSDVWGKAALLVAIIVLGYASRKLGWTKASDFHLLSRILLRITLPCALITSFDGVDLPPSLLYICGLGAAVVLTQIGAGYLLGRRSPPHGSAFGVLNVTAFNIGLFSIPLLGAFLGPQAVVYAVLFDIGQSFLAIGLAYSWAITSAGGHRVTVGAVLKRVFGSIVFDVYVVLLVLSFAHIRLPTPVIAFTSVVGGANTFLAMFAIGVGLEIVLDRATLSLALQHLGVRYLVSVAWFALVWLALPLDPLVRSVICLLLFAPLAAMMAAFTAEAGLNVRLSSFITSLSILVAVAAMPLLAGALV